jgi:predicted transcriptional regulator
LFKKSSKNYQGQLGGVDPLIPERDLVDLYIYGNNKGFQPSNLDVNVFKEYEEKYGPLKKYKLHTADDNYNLTNINKFLLDKFFPELKRIIDPDSKYRAFKKIIKNNNKEIITPMDSPPNNIKDDIGGHMLTLRRKGSKIEAQLQDIWKFTPEDYNKKWIFSHDENLLTYPLYSKQASLMEKSGKPFILTKSMRANNIDNYKKTLKKNQIKTGISSGKKDYKNLPEINPEDVLNKEYYNLSDFQKGGQNNWLDKYN